MGELPSPSAELEKMAAGTDLGRQRVRRHSGRGEAAGERSHRERVVLHQLFFLFFNYTSEAGEDQPLVMSMVIRDHLEQAVRPTASEDDFYPSLNIFSVVVR